MMSGTRDTGGLVEIQTLNVGAVNDANTGDVSAAGQLKTSIATGASPLVVASTTKVSNLNVDQVDGVDIAAAAAAATSGTFTQTMAGRTVITITPTSSTQFNASGGVAGQYLSFIITTSGTSSFTIVFGTNFKSTGNLTTGAVSGKVFTVSFICKDGTEWDEVARTVAM